MLEYCIAESASYYIYEQISIVWAH